MGKESVSKLVAALGNDDEFDALAIPGRRARPGSSKRKQYYSKRVANALRGCAPVADQPCYMHVIDLTLIEAAIGDMNPKNRPPTDMALAEYRLALLSTKPLPAVPAFTLHARQGIISTAFITYPVQTTLTQAQIAELIMFHEHVFGSILRLDKSTPSMRFNMYGAELAVLLVPLRRGVNDTFGVQLECPLFIDFVFVNKCNRALERMAERGSRPSDEMRSAFRFERRV
jgi:endoribonuclease Dicer